MREWRRFAAAVLPLAALGLPGCAGSGEGLDANGRPIGEADGIGTFEPTIESIQDHVFTPICAECHAGAGAPQGLVLTDAQTSYDNLVGVLSSEVPAYYRVLPGDPDASYLIHKLEGTQAVGNRMPNGCPATQPCLDAETIGIIREWIGAGAAPPAP
jgi:hypothetical protein